MMVRTPKARKQNMARGQYTYTRMLTECVLAPGQATLNMCKSTPIPNMRLDNA